MLEKTVKDRIKKLLDRMGIWYFMPVAGPFAVHGIPDFICCWDGKFLAIEAKAPGKLATLTVHQKRKIEEIQSANGIAVVVDNIEDLEQVLKNERDS